jgi:hypothetical protein
LWKPKLIFTGFILTTVGICLCGYLLKPPLDDFCTGIGYLPSNRATTSVQAVKVVVEPLWGRHHVYGIFQIDKEKCPPGQPVVLSVRGVGNYCEVVGFDPVQDFEGIEAPPGYYLTRHYIRTRTALWLSIQGLLDQLRQPRNWTLTYSK